MEKVIAFDGEQGSFRRTVQGVMREEGDAGLVCRISLGDGRHDIYNQVIVISVVGEFIYQGTLLIAISLMILGSLIRNDGHKEQKLDLL